MRAYVRDGSRGYAPASDISGSGMRSRDSLPRQEFQPRSPAGCCCWFQWGSHFAFQAWTARAVPFRAGRTALAVNLSVKTRGEKRQTGGAENEVTIVTSFARHRAQLVVGQPFFCVLCGILGALCGKGFDFDLSKS